MDRLGVDKAIRAWQLQGQAANMGKQGGKTWRENMGISLDFMENNGRLIGYD
jgi:hypothetical protein